MSKQDREEEIKRSDLSKLKEMYEAIEAFQQTDPSAVHSSAPAVLSATTSLRDTIIKIGNLARGSRGIGISSCDHDPDAVRIRNKYGYIQRHKENNINEDGIYFERLYQLSTVLSKGQTIDTNNELMLKQELVKLKQKIVFILSAEQNMVKDYNADWGTGDMHVKLNGLLGFAEKSYNPIALQQIKTELDLLDSSNWDSKEGRYYLARVFVIIGELAHELIQGKEVTKNIDKTLKELNNIRDSLLHKSHKKILKGNTANDTELAMLKDCIDQICHHLPASIKPDQSSQLLLDNYGELLLEKTKLLKQFFDGKSLLPNVTISQPREAKAKPTTQDKLIKNLKGIIYQAYTEFKEKEGAELVQVLSRIDIKYQKLLVSLKNRDEFPLKISTQEQEIIIKIVDSIKEAAEEKKQEKSASSSVPALPKTAELDKNKKIAEKIQKINDEVEYLKQIEISIEPAKQNMKDYIMQHIVCVIGQYVKRLEDIGREELLKTPSIILRQASSSAKTARNEELSHNIFSLDLVKFSDRVIDDILPADEHFQALFTIYKHKQEKSQPTSLSVITLNALGEAFLRFGINSEAESYFDQALKYVDDNPEKIDNIKLSSIGLEIEGESKIMFIDLEQECFGIDFYTLGMKNNLANTCILSGNYTKALNILLPVVNQVKFKNLQYTPSMEGLHDIALCLSSIGTCYYALGDYKQSINYHQDSLKLDQDIKSEIAIAVCNIMLGKYDESKMILKKLIYNEDPVIKFTALRAYIKLLSSYPKDPAIDEKIIKSISQLKSIKTDNQYFKKAFGDKYKLVTVFPALCLDLTVITNQHVINHSLFSRMHSQILEREKDIIDKIEQLNTNDKGSKELSDTYLVLSGAFSILASKAEDINSAISSVRKADKYFSNAKAFSGKNSSIGVQNRTKAAESLAIAYNECATKYGKKPETKLSYLRKVYKIQDEYNLDTSITLKNLGIEYLCLGKTHLDSFLLGNEQHYQEAFKNYDLAIKRITKALELDPNSKLMRTGNLSETYEGLATGYSGLGLLTYDVELIQKAVLNYQKVKNPVKEFKEVCLKSIPFVREHFMSLKNHIDQSIIEGLAEQTADEDVIEIGFSAKFKNIRLLALPHWTKKLPIEYEVKEKNIYVIRLKYGDAAICKKELENRINLLEKLLNPKDIDEKYDDGSALVFHLTEPEKSKDTQDATDNNQFLNYPRIFSKLVSIYGAEKVLGLNTQMSPELLHDYLEDQKVELLAAILNLD